MSGGYDFTTLHTRILRTGQYKLEGASYIIKAPTGFKKTKQQDIDESERRIEELREEIRQLEAVLDEKREKVAKEAEEMLAKADLEAERIVGESEKSAFDRVKKSLDDKENIIDQVKSESEQIINQARQEADRILSDVQIEAQDIRDKGRKEGLEKGRDEGFVEGKAELESMVNRLRSIIYATIQEREKILVHSEQQIMNLVLSMVRKVVKKLSEEEKDVVVNNTREALSIIRGAMKVFIHVNPQDYEYTLAHKDEFIRLIEGMPEVKFFENPSIERGGVFIETDIGEVDATIASQLQEIEDRIRFYIPMKVKTKGLENAAEKPQDKSEEGKG
jgi:flagellar assembly protein FliH